MLIALIADELLWVSTPTATLSDFASIPYRKLDRTCRTRCRRPFGQSDARLRDAGPQIAADEKTPSRNRKDRPIVVKEDAKCRLKIGGKMSTTQINHRFSLAGILVLSALSLCALALPLSQAKAQCLGIDFGSGCAGLGTGSWYSGYPYYYGYPSYYGYLYYGQPYYAYPAYSYPAYSYPYYRHDYGYE